MPVTGLPEVVIAVGRTPTSLTVARSPNRRRLPACGLRETALEIVASVRSRVMLRSSREAYPLETKHASAVALDPLPPYGTISCIRFGPLRVARNPAIGGDSCRARRRPRARKETRQEEFSCRAV